MGDEKAVLSVEEVAKRLGICQALVYRQIRTGIIPAVRVGDRYLIPIKAFEKWLSGESPAPAHTSNEANSEMPTPLWQWSGKGGRDDRNNK